jgi:DNA-directed RNA polymerase subunit beta
MAGLRMGKGIVRKSFGKIKDIVPVPDLIGIQCKSFNEFVQLDFLPSERRLIGLEKVLRDVFPIEYEDKMSLEYVSYELGHWACTCGKLTGMENRYSWSCSSCKASDCSRLPEDYACPQCKKKNSVRYKACSYCFSRVQVQVPMTVNECRISEQTFALPLKVKIQLITWDKDANDKKIVRDIKEQDIFFADIPVMTDLYEEGGQYKLGNKGTFVINGVDRVVVSQLHRSPGVVFTQSKKIKDVRGQAYYLARMIPMRGSWLDFEFDSNDLLYVRIDKKKKLFVTTFLQALGFTREEIIPLFYNSDTISYDTKGGFYKKVDEHVIGQRIERGMVPEEHAPLFLGKRVTRELLADLKKARISKLEINQASLQGRVLTEDLVHPETGEILAERGQSIGADVLALITSLPAVQFKLIVSSGYVHQPTIATTLAHDSCSSLEEALKELHNKLWPGDSSSLKEVKDRFENLFFNPRFYDLTRVGRIRVNRKLGLTIPDDETVLTKEDIVATVRYLVNLRERGEGELDDIDHLGNRRVRLVGELLNNQIYIGFMRIERIVRERFRTQEFSPALMPQDFLNVKPVSAVLREFFGTGQLSQFMDQTNPLSEIAHKRRLSALGPGGVMKDRATYEIRDVHTSHYGRICPIETPEGQTVGLISSLATYAMVNELGFIETAYRPVENKKIKDDVVFLDAFQEAHKRIAQADAVDSKTGNIKDTAVVARYEDEFLYSEPSEIDYVDLSPKQLVSVSTALIPFLEHDDATRALMGSNMQRQAVPLIKAETPIVGTGMEHEICKSSGVVLTARRPGVVEYVSSEKIVVRADEDSYRSVEDWIANGVEVYHLNKFQRSSHSTWIHQSPVVKVGDRVETGDILTTGPAVDSGELALGANLLVAFMPWQGYNFEDAIVVSKRLVAEDTLTSVHLEEYVVDSRDTKLGPEEITRDIPNVSEKALESLDEEGIVKIGTRVAPGDILVGKVTLKGDIQYSPEEKLLRAIFGEKSREVRDTSLRVPPGVEGTVIDVRVFSRSGIRKDRRYKDIVMHQVEKLEAEFASYQKSVEDMVLQKLATLMHDQESALKVSATLLKKDLFDSAALQKLSYEKIAALKVKDKKVTLELEHVKNAFSNQLKILEELKKERIAKLKKGDPLPSGVIKMVKIYIASKRHVSVGDKIAGRHGNKGVVSNIVPREDMPYLDDGTTIDIVLNPLGVPSRMNVGQILETILGFAGRKLGMQLEKSLEAGSDQIKKDLIACYGADMIKHYEQVHGKDGLHELAVKTAKTGLFFKTPVFDGPSFDDDIRPLLRSAELPETGTFRLIDGRSGEFFDQPVTVGSIYIMKLDHMVDDKLHARSVGPYSLVTQQPLGGKSQMGGQRFGEMEVWALEAYGAAYALQEMLTYKSDDVNGRHKVYSAIVRGEEIPEPGLPESFNVLVKELQSLGLQVDLIKSGKEVSGE